MKFFVKNKKFYTEDNSFSCAIGHKGMTTNKREGDLCTPVGEFCFEKIYYRSDKIGLMNFLLPSSSILENDGWCDDPTSEFYNHHIKFPFNKSAERLYRNDDLYDLICVLNYNTNPIIPGKGSAIFLHVCESDFKHTQGCVALEKHVLLQISKMIDHTSRIIIEA